MTVDKWLYTAGTADSGRLVRRDCETGGNTQLFLLSELPLRDPAEAILAHWRTQFKGGLHL